MLEIILGCGWFAFFLAAAAMVVGARILRRDYRMGWAFIALGLAIGLLTIPLLRPILAAGSGDIAASEFRIP